MSNIDGYVPVPGPVDREDFFAAQARNRRRGWLFTAMSALAIGLMGIPLSAVISPLLYAAAVVVVDLVGIVARTPDLLAGVANDSSSSSGPLSPAGVALVVGLIVVPGSLALLLSWLGVRRLFRRAGSGATVLALGARPPGNDIEERQLANVAGEMAAAAGVPPPAVMLLDSPVANAAAVGSALDDYTLVVTTGLLAELDREETQAVVAHLVASVGNGDLRIGSTVSSVFQTLGLVGSVLRAPSEGAPRTTLRRLLRYAFHRPGADDRAALAEVFAKAGVDAGPDYDDTADSGLKSMLLLPFVVAGMAFSMASMIFGWLVVNPFLRRAWWSRRHLADASAVRLTRNPDGLARALTTLATRGGIVPGTEWAAHLFAVGGMVPGPGDVQSPMPSFQPPLADRFERLRRMGATVPMPSGPRNPAARKVMLAVALVASPCIVSFFALMLGIAVVLTGVSLAIDSLFLAPMVALVHLLLRKIAGG
jgi:Zn-dependent protease with chaperone function